MSFTSDVLFVSKHHHITSDPGEAVARVECVRVFNDSRHEAFLLPVSSAAYHEPSTRPA